MSNLTPNTPLIHISFTYSKLNMDEICGLKSHLLSIHFQKKKNYRLFETPLSILLDLELTDRDTHMERPNHIERNFNRSPMFSIISWGCGEIFHDFFHSISGQHRQETSGKKARKISWAGKSDAAHSARVNVNFITSGRFFQILWPSHNDLTFHFR